MKLAIFSPYGSFQRESGLMYLVANYLDKQGGDVAQIRCDGAVPACGRDKKHQSGRTPFACLQCMGEQKALAQWANIKSRDLSSYIVPDDALKSAQWISSISKSDLLRIEFRGVRLWDVCEKEFPARWNIESLEKLSPAEERDLRFLYVAYVHTAVSSERFLTSWKPTLNFVVNSSDPLAQAYLSQVRRHGGDAAIFTYEAIGCRPAQQGVRAHPAQQGALSTASDERIRAISTHEAIGFRPAQQGIRARPAQQGVFL